MRSSRCLPILVLIVALAAGCRAPAVPVLPTAEQRAAYGDVAVTVAPPGPTVVERPTTGWAAGLGMGTVRGLGAIVVFAGQGAALAGKDAGNSSGEFGVIVLVTGAAIGAAVGVVYTPVSMIGGATTTPSDEEVDRAEVVILPLAHDPALTERFSALFVERARSRTDRAFVEPGAATTRVELRLVSIRNGRTSDWYTFDRPFELRVEASARVVRVADGQLVWEATRRTGEPPDETRSHTYVEWAANDGEEFRREIDAALDTLATGFAESIFVGAPPSE